MNRYEEYLYYKELTNELLMGNSNLPIREEKIQREEKYKKRKLYKNLIEDVKQISVIKEKEEIRKMKPVYTEEDLDYLKELNCEDLTRTEAYLLGRGKELRDLERFFYPNVVLNKKEEKEFDEEFDRLGDNLTIKLIYLKYCEIKKKKKK